MEREWWRDQPCPLNPSWNLHHKTELDLDKLRRTIDTDDNVNKLMVIENHIYRAFLEYHERGIFYNEKRQRKSEALKHLRKAESCTASPNWRQNTAAQIGYGTVINAFRLWIDAEDGQSESNLREFVSNQPDHPEYEAYVSVTLAYILSRLTPEVRLTSLSLYEKALHFQPDNCQWLFGKALMIGRDARQSRLIVSSWKSLPDDIKQKFNQERDILQDILETYPMFHLARAHYAQVLFQLSSSDKQARDEMDRALDADPQNRTICILAARFYRRMGPFEAAEGILQSMIERCNIAEVHSQLGYLYAGKSRVLDNMRDPRRRIPRYREVRRLRQLALHHFEQALHLDDSHSPSLTGKAEMLVCLGDKAAARDVYNDYLDHHNFEERPYIASDEFKFLQSALRHDYVREDRRVFSPTEIISMSHRFVIVSIFLTLRKPASERERLIEYSIRKLEKYSSPSQDEGIRRDAKLKLADAKFRLGKYREAIELYTSIYMDNGSSNCLGKVTWYLAKCHFHVGVEAEQDEAALHWEKAMELANKLSHDFPDSHVEYPPNEIRADVFLTKAKLAMEARDQRMDIAGGEFDESEDHLKMAVKCGSLEASYIYLETNIACREDYFKHGVTELLAHILYICDSGNTYHNDFDVNVPNSVSADTTATMDDTRESKRGLVRERVHRLSEYDLSNYTDVEQRTFNAIFTKLSDIRRHRLTLEVALIPSRDYGSDECTDALIATFRAAREILDKTISLCQKTFMTEKPSNSLFIIHFDWKEGKVDQSKAKHEVEKWARNKVFRGLQQPEQLDEILEKIVQIQPMYSEENFWMAALGSFNSLLKHDLDGTPVGETFPMDLKLVEEPIELKMSQVVEQSCLQVEKLVLFMVEQCRRKGRPTTVRRSSRISARNMGTPSS